MILDHFQLDSGAVLYNVPVVYTAYGRLAPTADNVVVVCHAFSGNTDVASWWRLIGHGYVLDPQVFYIICLNSLGSPYGTAAPTTLINGDPTLGYYGPLFPSTSIRDDVR
jgi:homoserine O-acetyltransferase